MSHVTIEELTIPATLDEPSGPEFATMIDLVNTVETLSYGTSELYFEPGEALPYYNDPFAPTRVFLARIDGELVGRATYEAELSEDNDTAWGNVAVLPEYRGSGIGTSLSDLVENIARDNGKAKLLAYTGVLDAPGEQLPSPTGFGAVPASNRDAQFLLSRGYTYEQSERISRLPLPISGLDDLVADASAHSGADYALHTWVGATPERWLESIALLNTRMSTDAPTAGLEEPEVVFTVERVREADERDKTSPRTKFSVGVEHVPTGGLVGYSELAVPAQRDRCVMQHATLVLREHRGHRLGMLLKVANLQHLERVEPGHPSVITFNAEENRHMLSVNESVGFVAIGSEACWRLNL